MFPARSPFDIPVKNKIDPAPGRWLRIAVHEQSESISNILRHHFTWQRQLTQFIAQALRPGDIFVDVGANLGYFTLVAANAVAKSGCVHAFEPEPRNFALLQRNLSLNSFDHVVCHQVAVGARSGEASLHLSDANLGAHSLMGKEGLVEGRKVSLMTLEDALASELRPLRLIKIDVQGLELQVLKGMERMLAPANPRPEIVMEFNPKDLQRSDPDLLYFRDFVNRFSYRIRAFIANERATVIPPEISLETLVSLHHDFASDGRGAEFDVLLSAW